LGNILTPLEKLENKWVKLEKLELEILEKSPYRTLENSAGSSPVFSAWNLHQGPGLLLDFSCLFLNLSSTNQKEEVNPSLIDESRSSVY
jgi:hypothetical protein